jgi:hypothetical protein
MASTSETGHDKNIANFDRLISFCQGYGTTYNPSKNSLKIPQLQTQIASIKVNNTAVTTSSVAYNNAVNARMTAFKDLAKLCTRLVNALDVTNASKELVKDAKTVNAKVSSGGKLTKADAGKSAAVDPNAPIVETPKTISTSQRSYDNLIAHFAKLIAILSTEPTYLPNENDLKIATLNTQLTNLKNVNTTVANTYTTLSNARISRDASMYNPTNGLIQTSKEVKGYVKSVFGASSAQYKQISGLEFKTIKK